jgi:hypothetical protein
MPDAAKTPRQPSAAGRTGASDTSRRVDPSDRPSSGPGPGKGTRGKGKAKARHAPEPGKKDK